MGRFPVDFQEVKRPLKTKSGKRPIKVGKRPIKEGKEPIQAMVLVGISVSCLMGFFFRAPPTWWKTAPLKRPIKRSMRLAEVPMRQWNRNTESPLNLPKPSTTCCFKEKKSKGWSEESKGFCSPAELFQILGIENKMHVKARNSSQGKREGIPKNKGWRVRVLTSSLGIAS